MLRNQVSVVIFLGLFALSFSYKISSEVKNGMIGKLISISDNKLIVSFFRHT